MALDFLKTALVTLLVTLDPPGLAPLFIGLTLGMTKAGKREVALRASVIAFVILAAFALGGRFVLGALGVTIPAFRIAGGLLLFYIAFDMVFALKAERRSEIATDAMAIDHIRNVAAVPLAIPLMAGPGSITATMLLADRANGDWLTLAGLLAIVALAMTVSFFALLAAFALGGRFVLGALGVTIPAFRIAGGLLLFYIAFDMLFALKAERRSEIVTDAMAIDHIRNVAAFPLAIPLMAGPGSITATMLLADRASGDWLMLAGLLAIIAVAMAASYLSFLAAERISSLLGTTGNIVATRMLGVVLAALAVQFAIDGAAQAWR